jgi:hypothetical protein
MKARTLTIAGLCAVAVALALPAGSIAAAPSVTPIHGSQSGTFSLCGLDLAFQFSFSGVAVVSSSGASLDAGQFTSIWTNLASGKTLVIHGAQAGKTTAATDNGDGTISFLQAADGLYLVKAANGGPISLQAGRMTARITIDATTGNLVSVELLSVDGPHSLPADSSCDSIVAALT